MASKVLGVGNSARQVTRKGMETIIGELISTEPKAKTSKPDDFLDTRFVSQLEKEGFYKAGLPK